MPNYRIVPERSQVWIEAKSSLHPIHGEGKGLSGSIEAEVVDGRLALNGAQPQIQLELPIASLKSGKAIEDAEMMRRVDARRYPTIRGKVTEVKESSGGRYHMRGDLTFHGVTKPVEGEVSMSTDGDSTIVFEGQETFDIRDFGVQPPKILMLKVHPDVNVRVRVVAQQEA